MINYHNNIKNQLPSKTNDCSKQPYKSPTINPYQLLTKIHLANVNYIDLNSITTYNIFNL